MRSIDCLLDGVSPGMLDSRMVVADVREHEPSLSRSVVRLGSGSGSLVTEECRMSVSVTVSVLVKERDVLQRGMLLQRLSLWSRGSVLRLPYRPQQELRVSCESLFSPGSMRDWITPLQLTFTARQVPFWQQIRPVSAEFTEEVRWYVPGTAPETPVDLILTNTGSTTVTCFALRAQDRLLSVDGMLLSPGQRVLGTTEGERLRLTLESPQGESSLLPYLTYDSHNLLTVPCGRPVTLSLTCDGSLTACVTARGRWL